MQRINATEKYLITKVVFLRFCGRFFTTPISLLIRLFNATHAKITYLCNRFGLLCSIIIPTSATRAVNDSLTPNLRKRFLFAKN